MLTVRAVAEKLAVSQATVYAIIAAGRLPHYRIGGAIRVSEAQLMAYLEASERGAIALPAALPPRRQPRPSRHFD
jgi:excisionase family DNA binding protein